MKTHNLIYYGSIHLMRPYNPPKGNSSHPLIHTRTFTTTESKNVTLKENFADVLNGRSLREQNPKKPNFVLNTKQIRANQANPIPQISSEIHFRGNISQLIYTQSPASARSDIRQVSEKVLKIMFNILNYSKKI